MAKYKYAMVWLEYPQTGYGEDVRKQIFTDKKGRKYVKCDGDKVYLRTRVPNIPEVVALKYKDEKY